VGREVCTESQLHDGERRLRRGRIFPFVVRGRLLLSSPRSCRVPVILNGVVRPVPSVSGKRKRILRKASIEKEAVVEKCYKTFGDEDC